MIELMPFAVRMGISLVESTPQRVVAQMLVRDDLCTAGAILHGGAVMAFADSVAAIGAMLNLPDGASTTTLESKTNFVRAVSAGDTARAVAEPVHLGGATMVWQTRIFRGDGKLAAVVTQTQMTLRPRP